MTKKSKTKKKPKPELPAKTITAETNFNMEWAITSATPSGLLQIHSESLQKRLGEYQALADDLSATLSDASVTCLSRMIKADAADFSLEDPIVAKQMPKWARSAKYMEQK